MDDHVFEKKLLNSIRDARNQANFWLKGGSNPYPDQELKNQLETEFKRLNRQLSDSILEVDAIQLKRELVSEDHWDQHTAKHTGAAMWALGQPVLKKRFVMQGAAARTSIASKYMSQLLPRKLPVRLLKTNVLGRVIGRAFPFVGGAIIVIDAVELLVTRSMESTRWHPTHGAHFGGGGATGSW